MGGAGEIVGSVLRQAVGPQAPAEGEHAVGEDPEPPGDAPADEEEHQSGEADAGESRRPQQRGQLVRGEEMPQFVAWLLHVEDADDGAVREGDGRGCRGPLRGPGLGALGFNESRRCGAGGAGPDAGGGGGAVQAGWNPGEFGGNDARGREKAGADEASPGVPGMGLVSQHLDDEAEQGQCVVGVFFREAAADAFLDRAGNLRRQLVEVAILEAGPQLDHPGEGLAEEERTLGGAQGLDLVPGKDASDGEGAEARGQHRAEHEPRGEDRFHASIRSSGRLGFTPAPVRATPAIRWSGCNGRPPGRDPPG